MSHSQPWSPDAAARLLQACERVVMQAPSIRRAVESAAVEIRRATGWRFAESYLFDAREGSSELIGVDHDGTPALIELQRSRAAASRGNIAASLVERLRGGHVLLIDPLVPGPEVNRADEAIAAGLVSAICLPVFRQESPFALLVFVDDEPLRGTPWADVVVALVAPLTDLFQRRARQIEFGELWDFSPDAMMILDYGGRVLEMNPAVTDMLGWLPEEIAGAYAISVVDPDDTAVAVEMLSRLRRDEHLDRPIILRLRKRDGTFAPIHLRSRALPSESSILLVGRDLSTVEHLEQENSRLARAYHFLQRSNEVGRHTTSEVDLFQAACDLAVTVGGYPMAWIGRVDAERHAVTPVAFSGDTTGYLDGLEITIDDDAFGHGPSGRAVRQGTYQISHDIQSDPSMSKWAERATRAGLRASAAFPMVVGDVVIGNMTFYAAASGWFGPDEVTVLTDVVRNIASAVESLQREASRLRAEAAVRRLEASRLRTQRLESIGTLAGGIAHDLNNTLAPILMSAEMLGQMVEPEAQRAYVKIIETSAKRGAALVRQVLGFARGLEGERLRLSAAQLVRDVSGMLSDTMLKDVKVEAELIEPLAPIVGDPTQLHQVLLNLCVNAAQAMGNSGTVRICAEMRSLDEDGAQRILGGRPGTYVTIAVHDTGEGIRPDYVERIFDPFFTTKPQGSGTGLGLSTSLGIVRDHEGFIEVRSAVGSGSTFRVYLPMDLDAATTRAPVPSSAPAPLGRDELILLVEDEGVVRSLVRDALERHGYRVEVAEDGAEGIAAFAARVGEVDLVLTDLKMPVMGGIPMLNAMRRLRPSVRAIAMSGFDASMNGANAREAHGVYRVIHKPFEINDLLTQVREVLDLTLDPARYP